MANKVNVSVFYLAWSAFSTVLNLFFMRNLYVGGDWNLSWSKKAAAEAEAVAAISCSGHGRAYLDGLVLHGKEPICDCNSCYGGPDCSLFLPACPANADGGDPYFLEPFWMQHATNSALVVAGWHRMGYSYSDHSPNISPELESHIRTLHSVVGNAITAGRYIVFGAGSTQLLNAAVNALSSDNSSTPARVVALFPYYPVYKMQTELFQSKNYTFEGDASLWENSTSNATMNFIEFVTSPNNPDGQLRKAVLHGHPNAKAIYDHAYYWPHFSPIPTPADEDVMTFTISKLTGHAGARFGWAIIKDEAVYERMTTYMALNTIGVSRDSQLRALKLIKVVLEDRAREIFEFGYEIMRDRWEKLSKTLSTSKRFSLQKLAPQYCSFSQKVRAPSPAYAWLKCEREEDRDCYSALEAAGITGREGGKFGAELDRYVRLSLIRSQDDFDLLLHRLSKMPKSQGKEEGAKPL
ncbi:tryptophan aminotransferase-related protein 3-like [Corylus avellana]|uniref:tryptophan aminotransferase-related protein 3-like n=1 Tax=Corylus avellana TaxID=13451 RepID=UPI001E20640C|nr:tryptophan aminotransferase-related protein 3-like [Corylus avellana]